MQSPRFRAAFLTFLCFTCLGSLVVAQDAPKMPQPTREHEWLKKFVGEWDVVSKGSMVEGQPPMETRATITSEAIGGFWVLNRMEGKVAGMTFNGIQTIGYDVKKKKYVGTWVDSMTNYMWTYRGTVEKSGTKLVLEAEGPNMANPDKTASYRDSYEFTDDNTFVVTSTMKNSKGEWVTFMSGTGKRKQPNQKR